MNPIDVNQSLKVRRRNSASFSIILKSFSPDRYAYRLPQGTWPTNVRRTALSQVLSPLPGLDWIQSLLIKRAHTLRRAVFSCGCACNVANSSLCRLSIISDACLVLQKWTVGTLRPEFALVCHPKLAACLLMSILFALRRLKPWVSWLHLLIYLLARVALQNVCSSRSGESYVLKVPYGFLSLCRQVFELVFIVPFLPAHLLLLVGHLLLQLRVLWEYALIATLPMLFLLFGRLKPHLVRFLLFIIVQELAFQVLVLFCQAINLAF